MTNPTAPVVSVQLELTTQDLHLIINALRTYLSDYGHDEADVRRQIQSVLHKLESETTTSTPAG
jgi:hypothetical protein